jgi:hypothetical protein
MFKMNIDGSSACRGIQRNQNNTFMKELYCKLSSTNSIFAEASALPSEILLARDLGVKDIIFETDSLALFHIWSLKVILLILL